MLFGVKKSSTPSPALNNDRSLTYQTLIRRLMLPKIERFEP